MARALREIGMVQIIGCDAQRRERAQERVERRRTIVHAFEQHGLREKLCARAFQARNRGLGGGRELARVIDVQRDDQRLARRA